MGGTDTPAAMRTSEAMRVGGIGKPLPNDGAVYSAIKSAREVDSCSAHSSSEFQTSHGAADQESQPREAPSHPAR